MSVGDELSQYDKYVQAGFFRGLSRVITIWENGRVSVGVKAHPEKLGWSVVTVGKEKKRWQEQQLEWGGEIQDAALSRWLIEVGLPAIEKKLVPALPTHPSFTKLENPNWK